MLGLFEYRLHTKYGIEWCWNQGGIAGKVAFIVLWSIVVRNQQENQSVISCIVAQATLTVAQHQAKLADSEA